MNFDAFVLRLASTYKRRLYVPTPSQCLKSQKLLGPYTDIEFHLRWVEIIAVYI